MINRKLKYGLVLAAGVLIVLIAEVMTRGSNIVTEDRHTSETETVVPEITEATDNETEVTSSEDAEDGSLEETSFEMPETEKLTEDENITEGLSSYFRHKLTVNPEVTHSYLNIRRYPSEDSEIMAILYPNEVMTYVSKCGDWYGIECDGYTGYVNAAYVLTDSKAYEASKHNIGYAAMIRNFDTVLYEEADAGSAGIRLADKGDVYTVTAVIGDFYRLDVVSEYVDYLYVKKDDVLLFYQFLGPNVTNGLDEGTEEYLASRDLGDCTAEADSLAAEGAAEKAEREAALEAAAEASREAEEASIQASIEEAAQAAAASAEAEEAYRASVQASIEAQEAAEAASRAEESQNVKSSAYAWMNARSSFVASYGSMSASDVCTSGTYAVTLDRAVIEYTVNLCSQYGIDPAVIFSVMYHESRFHVNSVNSSTGSASSLGREGMAYGLMQIIPYWNKDRIASDNISYPDGLYDPYNNILVGVQLLVEKGACSDMAEALSVFRTGSVCDTGLDYAASVLRDAQQFDNRQ